MTEFIQGCVVCFLQGPELFQRSWPSCFRGSELFGVFISLMSVPQTYLVVFLELSKLYPACWSSEIVVYRKEAVTKDLGLFG